MQSLKRWVVFSVAGLMLGLAVAFVVWAVPALAAGYNGCPTNQAKIAIRLSGNASTYPSCNLQRCVNANPNQRVKIYGWSATIPPQWVQMAEYRSHYGATSASAPACPSYVENAAWLP